MKPPFVLVLSHAKLLQNSSKVQPAKEPPRIFPIALHSNRCLNPAAVAALALPVASVAAAGGVCDALATPGVVVQDVLSGRLQGVWICVESNAFEEAISLLFHPGDSPKIILKLLEHSRCTGVISGGYPCLEPWSLGPKLSNIPRGPKARKFAPGFPDPPAH